MFFTWYSTTKDTDQCFPVILFNQTLELSFNFMSARQSCSPSMGGFTSSECSFFFIFYFFFILFSCFFVRFIWLLFQSCLFNFYFNIFMIYPRKKKLHHRYLHLKHTSTTQLISTYWSIGKPNKTNLEKKNDVFPFPCCSLFDLFLYYATEN